ncbi:class I adenylate-forming enzyme family protein [Kutzneria sp. CA-103260]|uniref:class I adenylate-forming enzyme family protein n=1 Tax=Kutzneria sp. CA-103260 TaxID=2802641 RepID=UPI001BA5E8C7|nr:AMP-binding protein [Kutzneria sp. CA-103260]QUQ68835.1 acyl-CoA synthetase [Kutzneria sp. CA-103260]
MRPYVWDPWRTADRHPDRLAVIAGDESCTFGEITARADALAAGLAARGVADGAVVSTDIPSGPRFFALALAALRHGHGLLPVDRELFDGPAGAAILTDTAAAIHVTDRPLAGLSARQVLDDDLAAAGRGARETPDRPAGWLMFVSSGTTGQPQAVPRPRPWRPYRGVAVAERYAAGVDKGPCLMTNPAYHLGTLGPALYALQAGSAVVVQRTWSAEGFVELVDRHRADSALLSPDGLLDVVESGAAPLRSLTVVFHSGSACPPDVKRAGIALLGPVLHEFYGTSRSTITEITSPEWLRHPGSVGRPLPGIRIDIMRDGEVLPAGEVGEIQVRLREADHADGESSHVDTGDIGFLDADGYLSVIGRADAEGRWNQALLEHEVRLLAGVSDVAALADKGVCFVEVDRDGRADPTADVLAAAERLRVPVHRVRVAPRGSLPRTRSGKLARAQLAAEEVERPVRA